MKIAFIGGGNMGEAVLAAVLKKGMAAPAGIEVNFISAWAMPKSSSLTSPSYERRTLEGETSRLTMLSARPSLPVRLWAKWSPSAIRAPI